MLCRTARAWCMARSCTIHWEKKAPFIANSELERIWGHGFTKITALDSVDNVGLYLTAYLTDVSLDEAVETDISVRANVKSKIRNDKKYIKGTRLRLYPANCRLYRTSRGIKKPEHEWMPPDQAFRKVRHGKLTFEKNVHITDTDTGYDTTISTWEYNMKK